MRAEHAIDDSGNPCGHVNLGDLGVADRCADLAVAIMSLGWNYRPGAWERELLDAYGVEEDPVRIDYYRTSPATGWCPQWRPGDITSR